MLALKGEISSDFYISHEKEKGFPGWINLLGIDSPDLTAAIAIGEDVAEDVGEDIGAVGAVGESHGFANVQVTGNNQNMSFERIEIPSFSMFAF